jgi:hypothetical protein
LIVLNGVVLPVMKTVLITVKLLPPVIHISAKNLLRGERTSLADVADRVGYQSANAFSTAFTRLTGRTPSEFARDENSCDANMR